MIGHKNDHPAVVGAALKAKILAVGLVPLHDDLFVLFVTGFLQGHSIVLMLSEEPVELAEF